MIQEGINIYISKPNQSLYDIAVDVHGSIDGVADLMINNPDISLLDNIQEGTKIYFTDAITLNEEVVNTININNTTVANSESKVYPKYSKHPVLFDIMIPKDVVDFSMVKSGGELDIDWGDDTNIEFYDSKTDKIKHTYSLDDNQDLSSYIRVRCYSSDSSLQNLNIESNNASVIVFYDEVDIKKYKDNSELIDPKYILLFNGLADLEINNAVSADFSYLGKIQSIRNMQLNTPFTTPEAMDGLFMSIVENYGANRLPATISVKVKPNGEYKMPENKTPANGMEAVWVLINSEEWNSEAYQWKISIDGFNYETTKQ